MASEASWQSGSAGEGNTTFDGDQPMDQRTVETLLRRLVERVEASERRYGEALDQLHTRLDRLSETTEAARDIRSPEDADTFDRLHTQVSNLARRLDHGSSSPLDDFERLGKALSGGLHQDAADTHPEPYDPAPEASPFAQSAMVGEAPAQSAAPEAEFYDIDCTAPLPSHLVPAAEVASQGFGSLASELDKKLVEMAQRLEHSIDTAAPAATIEALNARLDEIGSQLSQTLERAPTRETLDHVEQQISDMSQQVNRAEEQLGKIAGIESQLIELIERLDKPSPANQMDPAQLEEIANKAATEAARLVAAEAKQETERLDAIHRDLTAMGDKSRETDERLASTLETVHQSLKQLVQQVERGSSALQPSPRGPFVERSRQAQAKATPAKESTPEALPTEPVEDKAPAPAKSSEEAQGALRQTLRERLGAAIPDYQGSETPPAFGRANRASPDEEAVDLDTTPAPEAPKTGARSGDGPDAASKSEGDSSPAPSAEEDDKDLDAPGDLVAAARRAAQAAALRATEGRGGRQSSGYFTGDMAGTEDQGRRKRSMLIIAAAVLLGLSALLLYGRLMSKPEMEADPSAPGIGEEIVPATEPEKSGSWAPLPATDESATDSAHGQSTPGFTDVAKSPLHQSPVHGRGMPASELRPEPQFASLKPAGPATLPPGVTFSIEDPAFQAEPTPQGRATPATLTVPPKALGPLPLREAAVAGDAKAQFVIGVRYADGTGTKRDMKMAARWLKPAAKAGLAPAQYRLAAMYERGLGVGQDPDQAQSWYAAAAESGHVKAMHNLAVSVSGRDGSTPNYTLAAKWYGKAAAHGLADSQFNLGILAEHGLGGPKNLVDAYKWFSLAAIRGDGEAAKRREVIRVQLAPDMLAKTEAAVKGWKAKEVAADANHVAEQPGWAAAAPATTQNATLVNRAQTLLNTLGYDVGPPDGLVGNRTRTAIKLFQRRNGLDATGKVSIPLVTKLEGLAT